MMSDVCCKKWTETPPVWSAGKCPEGFSAGISSYSLDSTVLVGGGGVITCAWAVVCPSENQKKEKIGVPFWLAILAGVSGAVRRRHRLAGRFASGSTSRCGARVVQSHTAGDATVGGTVENSTKYIHTTNGFLLDNKMC